MKCLGNCPEINPSRRDDVAGGAMRCPSLGRFDALAPRDHNVTYGTASSMTLSQAFHAWLPSVCPSGTIGSRIMLTRMRSRGTAEPAAPQPHFGYKLGCGV